jgi:hypothetical protein
MAGAITVAEGHHHHGIMVGEDHRHRC